MGNKPYNENSVLPQLFRGKIWNGLLFCVEVVAHGKDIRACRAEGTIGNFMDKGQTRPVMGYSS